MPFQGYAVLASYTQAFGGRGEGKERLVHTVLRMRLIFTTSRENSNPPRNVDINFNNHLTFLARAQCMYEYSIYSPAYLWMLKPSKWPSSKFKHCQKHSVYGILMLFLAEGCP